MEGQGWVDNCTRIILGRRHKPSTLIRNQEALLFWGVIHCKLYQQKYWQCLLDSSLPSGQAALKSSLPQQLLIYFFNNKPLSWALCLQTSDWMKSLPGRKFYLSQMTGQQLLWVLTVGHSQDLLVNKLKYSASSDILCLTELLAIKGSILLLFSYLFC